MICLRSSLIRLIRQQRAAPFGCTVVLLAASRATSSSCSSSSRRSLISNLDIFPPPSYTENIILSKKVKTWKASPCDTIKKGETSVTRIFHLFCVAKRSCFVSRFLCQIIRRSYIEPPVRQMEYRHRHHRQSVI